MARNKVVTVSHVNTDYQYNESEFCWWRKSETFLSDFIISIHKTRNVVAGVLVDAFCYIFAELGFVFHEERYIPWQLFGLGKLLLPCL